jgi:hypothetical protein
MCSTVRSHGVEAAGGNEHEAEKEACSAPRG